ncbi:hypothetical protein [Roseivivax sp. THAF30]|uniref:hypothetical protein n=1 Tax=Roseivivax sp. THAF30 TaxID=2587852 RepID=UPI0012685279|nr:hypothetical protein [Roseivivax sp. THAF30]QFT64258.1 hypothetical protein FIU91_15070 [Roseivivax sp. THAF30]
MLRRTLTAAILIATSATGTVATAQDGVNTVFEITMLGSGYFPEVAYVDPDDSIRFYNASNVAMAATALDLSWSTGLVSPGETVTLSVTNEDGEIISADFDNSVPEMGGDGLISAVLDPLVDTVSAEGRIETSSVVPDFRDAFGRPISDEEAVELFGEPTVDTDGDGDPDGYDWYALLTPEKTTDPATTSLLGGEDEASGSVEP